MLFEVIDHLSLLLLVAFGSVYLLWKGHLQVVRGSTTQTAVTLPYYGYTASIWVFYIITVYLNVGGGYSQWLVALTIMWMCQVSFIGYMWIRVLSLLFYQKIPLFAYVATIFTIWVVLICVGVIVFIGIWT